MSSRRAERLVNLVICLLSTRQYLTAERIRGAVPGYVPADGTERADEAFKRMFERDKAELRELGIPLEVGRTSVFDTEDGYRIARPDYVLPDIELTAREAAAVGLAARLWQSAQLAGAAQGALLKLRAGGVDVDPQALTVVEPRVSAGEAAFDACLAAVRARHPIAFDYRTVEGVDVERRELEPWGVVSWRGRWYVVGHDRVRGASRCFRLSRIQGEVTAIGEDGTVDVPTGVDLTDMVAAQYPHRPNLGRVRVRPGAAAGLRRAAETIEPGGDGADGDILHLRFADPDGLGSWIASYGTTAVVLDPPELRDAVIARLRALAHWRADGRPGADPAPDTAGVGVAAGART